jgi:hypothetical protein
VLDFAAGREHVLIVDDTGRLWAWGENDYGFLGDGTDTARSVPVPIPESPQLVTVAAGREHSAAIAADGTVWTWGRNYWGELGSGNKTEAWSPQALSMSAVDNSWGVLDSDSDGLSNALELALGSDPLDPDTNADGIPDGLAVALGLSPTDPDMDDDGLANAAEIAAGTDPFNPDTDGDGVPDGADAYPLDPSASEPPDPDPQDQVPPTVTILSPPGAVLVGSNPPL